MKTLNEICAITFLAMGITLLGFGLVKDRMKEVTPTTLYELGVATYFIIESKNKRYN